MQIIICMKEDSCRDKSRLLSEFLTNGLFGSCSGVSRLQLYAQQMGTLTGGPPCNHRGMIPDDELPNSDKDQEDNNLDTVVVRTDGFMNGATTINWSKGKEKPKKKKSHLLDL